MSVGEGIGGGGGGNNKNQLDFFLVRSFSPLPSTDLSYHIPCLFCCSTPYAVGAKPGFLDQSIVSHLPLHLSSLFSCVACYVVDGKPGTHDLLIQLALQSTVSSLHPPLVFSLKCVNGKSGTLDRSSTVDKKTRLDLSEEGHSEEVVGESNEKRRLVDGTKRK